MVQTPFLLIREEKAFIERMEFVFGDIFFQYHIIMFSGLWRIDFVSNLYRCGGLQSRGERPISLWVSSDARSARVGEKWLNPMKLRFF